MRDIANLIDYLRVLKTNLFFSSQGDETSSPSPGFLPNHPSFSTRAIHAGFNPDNWRSGALVPPITLAAAFRQTEPDKIGVSERGRHPQAEVL